MADGSKVNRFDSTNILCQLSGADSISIRHIGDIMFGVMELLSWTACLVKLS